MNAATKAWLDTVAEGSDHESLCACEVFAALETGDGRVSAECSAWLTKMQNQRRFPLVSKAACAVLRELGALRGAA